MRKFKVFAILVGLVFLASTAFAAVGVNAGGVYVGEATTINFPPNSVTFDGSTITMGAEGRVRLPITDFIAIDTDTNDLNATLDITEYGLPTLTLSSPGLALVWDSAEESRVLATFRIPSDYSSGGNFRVFVDETPVTATTLLQSPSFIDFRVRVEADGIKWGTESAQHAAVSLSTDLGTPELVTLTVSTENVTFAAGDVVSLELWRSATAPGDGGVESTRSLYLYYVEFYYARN